MLIGREGELLTMPVDDLADHRHTVREPNVDGDAVRDPRRRLGEVPMMLERLVVTVFRLCAALGGHRGYHVPGDWGGHRGEQLPASAGASQNRYGIGKPHWER